MTDVPINTGNAPLGVGKIIGDTFSLFFGRFASVAILGIVPAILLVLLQYVIAPGTDFSDPAALSGTEFSIGRQVIGTVLNIVGSALVTALIIRFAYDAKIGNPIQINSYFSSALKSLVPIVICSIIVGLATGIAAIALIIPGLYVYAMWSVVTPSIVIEDAGFGALGRSFELTRNYRWPVLGTIMLMWICAIIPMAIIGGILGAAGAASNIGLTTIILGINAVATGLVMAFFGIGVALIYARLREIKEGTSVEQLAEVFA